MAIEQTLVPSYICVTYDGTELNIVDAQFSLNFSNGSIYEEEMTATGQKGYLLRKGITVSQEGNIFVTITKTGDGKQDDTISFLEDKIREISKSENPEEYSKAIILTCKDSGEEQFLTVSFSGFIKELKILPSKKGNAFTDYIAEFEIFDPLSITIEN